YIQWLYNAILKTQLNFYARYRPLLCRRNCILESKGDEENYVSYFGNIPIFVKQTAYFQNQNPSSSLTSGFDSGISSYGISICSDPLSCILSFVSAFTNAVQSSKILSDVFDINQSSPSIFRRFHYDNIFPTAPNHGLTFPHFISNHACQPLEENFNFLEAPIMALEIIAFCSISSTKICLKL
ncbi:unnamed protein product, partial [Larinioides sclopetarius]